MQNQSHKNSSSIPLPEPLVSPADTLPAKGLSILVPIFQFLVPYKARVVAAMIALVFTAGMSLSIGQGLRLMIDDGFNANSPELLDRAVLIFLGLVVCLAAGSYSRFYLVSWLGERVVADIRKAVFNHLVQLHPGFFETHHSGDIQSRITTDTTLLQTVIGSSLSMALRNTLLFIGGFVWLFITNIKLSLIVFAVVPFVVMPIVIFGRRVRRLARSSQDRVGDVGAYVGEAVHHIKTVQAYNHQIEDMRLFGLHVENAFDVAKKRVSQRALLMGVVILLVMGAVGAMMWVGGHDVLEGRISGGELAAFVFYAVIVGMSVGAISEVIGDLQRAAGAAERILELLATKNDLVVPETPLLLPEPLRGDLSIDHLSFHYATRKEQWVIDDLSLLVEAGTVCALVGSSGAGKTTLFDLLLRFYDPQKGAILLDSVPIAKLDPLSLRAQIGLVSQKPALFTGSIRDNIAYGSAGMAQDAIITAAKAAYAHDFIEQLPDGYDTLLGEHGVGLSGGQQQRIAIARAVLKDPKILLLDEATSALDAESEHQVQKALNELMKGRTTLVIAHRLATVLHADKIAVLNKGRIEAVGTHTELIA
ncbi:MAG: ATP-binding cassette domain-containing protein, partial [Pseudomonadales bacterium]|nr:ATP-binding cassette domain-containing protein [Pseudomonadales bacterium]